MIIDRRPGVQITHKPTGVTVVCRTEKSYHRNKVKALAMLKARVQAHEEGLLTSKDIGMCADWTRCYDKDTGEIRPEDGHEYLLRTEKERIMAARFPVIKTDHLRIAVKKGSLVDGWKLARAKSGVATFVSRGALRRFIKHRFPDSTEFRIVQSDGTWEVLGGV